MPIVSSALADFGTTLLANAAMLLGAVLWIIAYALIIRKCFKDHTFGVPWPNICLNITWELYFGFLCPAGQESLCLPPGISLWLTRAWFALDCIIFFQFLHYGRSSQPLGLRRYFYAVVLVAVVLAFAGQVTYVHFYSDKEGTEIAWLINQVMSLLFVVLFFLRPQRQGLSYLAAWAKMLGSALTAIGLLLSGNEFAAQPYGKFLFLSTFVADAFYVYLLSRALRDA